MQKIGPCRARKTLGGRSPEGAEASPVYLLRLINSVKRRSISNVILGLLSSIHVFGQCLLGSRPLTLHQRFKFCQTIQTMSAQSAYHQIWAVIPVDLGNLLNTLGTFLASSSSFRNAAKTDCSWNQRSMITIETIRIFGGSNNFKSVIQLFISIFEILWWVLAFLWI